MALVVLSCDSGAVGFNPTITTIAGTPTAGTYPVCVDVGGTPGWQHQGVFSLTLDEVNQLIPSGLLILAIAWVITLIRQKLLRS